MHIYSDILRTMDPSWTLRDARQRAHLSQSDLADACGTSQPTISAYEAGRKQPSVETLDRLLSAAGARLRVETGHQSLVVPSPRAHARTARALTEVLALAAALPTRHSTELRFPRLS